MKLEHTYHIKTYWEGNTKDIKKYSRTHTISNTNKPTLVLTTDNAAVGDKTKLNPEDLLVSAISSCHMLSYLYLCSLAGIVVVKYEDNATGLMIEKTSGGGSFKEVNLNPIVCIEDKSKVFEAIELHHKAHDICYIANSMNFEVTCTPQITAL
ncbi:MAG: peroxiredoxin [Bacteroidetes bacterium B1(2017)]|nr:MAG: peroxiredoxin [Bacteroidetes bacterium B1(2017)]